MSFWQNISYSLLLFFCILAPASGQQQHWVKLINKEIRLDNENPKIELIFELQNGMHIQANKVNDPNFIPTRIDIAWPSSFQIDSAYYSTPKQLKMIGQEKPLMVFSKKFTVGFLVKGPPTGSFEIPGELYYQACNAYKCFFPRTLSFSIKVVSHEKAP